LDKDIDACPTETCGLCGLTFPGGKRTYSTFGKPTISREAHLANHEERRARAEELAARAAWVNTLPGVLPHLPEEECELLDEPAQDNPAIRLPVWERSRTTGGSFRNESGVKPPLGPNGVEMFDLYELPSPALDGFIKHAQLFGCDCVWATAQTDLSDRELAVLGAELKKIAAEHKRARKPKSWWENAAPHRLPKVPEEDTSQKLAEQSRVRTKQQESKKRSQRRNNVREDILKLHREHPLLLPGVIADRVDVSERRVRRVLTEAAQPAEAA
jgi:hypothetical protein